MEASTEARGRKSLAEPSEPSGVAKAAEGVEPTAQEEHEGTNWLLSATPPDEEYTVPVKVSPDSEDEIDWVVRRLDVKFFEGVDTKHRNPDTGRLDGIAAVADTVVAATVSIDGVADALRKPDFLEGAADPADALRRRFAFEWGLMDQLSTEIRRLTGYDFTRVGSGKRRLARATKN